MSSSNQITRRYRIKAVAELTGLTTHAIRKWEKRYNLFAPLRAENGYRVYSDQDLQLLMYVKTQVDAGKSIRQLAALGTDVLLEAIASDPLDVSEIPESWREGALTVVQAARRMDQMQVERVLQQSLRDVGMDEACDQFFFPLLRSIGDLWHQGKLTLTSEHLVSQTTRRLLAESILAQKKTKTGPTAVVGCLPKDFHDIGAMTASGILQRSGWRTFYLGPDVDIELIHFSCMKRQSKLVILACIVEQTPEDMKDILFDISKFLLPISTVVIGGLGANLYRDWLEKRGIHVMSQLKDLKNMTPESFNSQQHLTPVTNGI